MLHLRLFCLPDQGCRILKRSLCPRLVFSADSAFGLAGSQGGVRRDGNHSGAVLISPESVWTQVTVASTSACDPVQPLRYGRGGGVPSPESEIVVLQVR
jgi:hypothetical protein